MGNPLISVLTWTHNWQKMFDITIPCWLSQEGVDFEIVAGCGPSITLPVDTRVRRVEIATKGKCGAYNALIDASRGEYLLLTQADIQVNSPTQLKRMLAAYSPGKMVTERFFKDGKRDSGVYHQCMLVAKADVIAAGKCDPAFDDPSMYAFEDTDLVVRLLKLGLSYEILSTPESEGAFHIHHPSVDLDDPIIQAKINKARELYTKKHGKDTILGLYAKQIAKRITGRRFVNV